MIPQSTQHELPEDDVLYTRMACRRTSDEGRRMATSADEDADGADGDEHIVAATTSLPMTKGTTPTHWRGGAT